MSNCLTAGITLAAVLSWPLALQAQPPESGPPLRNAGFEVGQAGESPPGWRVRNSPGYDISISTDAPAEGSQSAAIFLPPEASPGYGNLIQRIDPGEFRGKRVRLRGAVRAEVAGQDNRVFMWFRVDRRDKDGTRRQGAFDNMWDRPITNNQWQYYEIVGDVDDDATDITFGLFLRGKGRAWFDDASLETVGNDVAVTAKKSGARSGTPIDEIKPGLFEVVSSIRLTPNGNPWFKVQKLFSEGDPAQQQILMPLPLSYRDQVPLGFQLKVDPPAAVIAIDVFRDKGDNYVLKLIVDEIAKWKQVDINYSSVVLVGPSSFDSVPKTALVPERWPEETIPWLRATWCADADNPRIILLANSIRAETNDVLAIIKQVELQASQIFNAATGQVRNLTAVESLDKQGSCTSCANLVAAMLRAANIPARIVAGYPSWTGPLQTHYIVEAYVPDFGWYPIESTRCESPWPNTHQVNVAIIPPEYEEENKAALRFGIAGGVPYLSLTEMPDNSGSVLAAGMVDEARGCDHLCTMLRALSGGPSDWQSAIAVARSRWESWLRDEHQLNADGQLSFGIEAKNTNVISLDEWGALSDKSPDDD